MSYEPLTFPRGAAQLGRLIRDLIRQTRAFRRLFAVRRPDVILVSTSTLTAALLAARLEGIPAVTRVAELYRGRSVTGRRRLIPARALLTLTERLSGSIVCASDAVARQFSGYGKPHVVVAYPTIHADLPAGDGAGFRLSHGIASNAAVVACAGNISRGRGQDVLVRAMSQICEEVPGAVCVIAGAPHERAVDLEFDRELRRLTEELGLAEAVRFVGVCGTMRDLYAAADVVVNPARAPEAFGRVAAEALVAGTPVVSTHVGGTAEVLSREEDALLVEPDDPKEVARAAVRLLTDRALAEALVSRGRENVVARFNDTQAFAALSRAVEIATA